MLLLGDLSKCNNFIHSTFVCVVECVCGGDRVFYAFCVCACMCITAHTQLRTHSFIDAHTVYTCMDLYACVCIYLYGYYVVT